MAELTPVPLDSPTRAVVAALLTEDSQHIELVLRMGWETTQDGQVLPVPLVAVRSAQ